MTSLLGASVKTVGNVSRHYNQAYYEYQRRIGAFGGRANKFKFEGVISPGDTVVDFGCGGGFLLRNLDCARRIGIEPNASTHGDLVGNGIEAFSSASDLVACHGERIADVIISNHALEHSLCPYNELVALRSILKDDGVICFVVPCESKYYKYTPGNIFNHLYTFAPVNLGNLFVEAGFKVKAVEKLDFRWPPFYLQIAKFSWKYFMFLSRVYGLIDFRISQTRIVAKKDLDRL
jgi:hypothetical protein